MDDFNKKYQVEIQCVTANEITIIQAWLPSHESKINKKIEDIYNEMSKIKLDKNDKYLLLEVSGEKDDITVKFPLIEYYFQK